MNTYKKRIAFCLSDQHTIPHGGLGQFAKSFIETFTPLGYKVDIILDKPASNIEFKTYLEEQGARFICAEPISYTNHTKTFMFEDSFNFEKMVNFRESMMKALNENLYDIIICNTLESFPAIYSLNLQKSIQVIYYTHNESMVFLDDREWKNEFTESFNETFNALMGVKGITIGTQTLRNLSELHKSKIPNAKYLPILMTEKTLLQTHIKPKEGVLWIGRWEPRKNPEAFIEMIQKTGLPAKVITNATGAKKFETALQAINATYEIKSGIYGQEKVDFLTSARVAYNPAIRESFGLAFYETIGHMPTVAIEGMSWLKNFPPSNYFAVQKKAVASVVLDLYSKFENSKDWYQQGVLESIRSLDRNGIEEWERCFDSFECIKSESERAKINEVTLSTYKDFIISLNRKALSIDDVRSVLTNKHKFNIIYTDTQTYISKDKNFVPKEESDNSLESLFV
jgi:glycosyltransferase involved in cell wall biosynthesis